MKKILIHGEDKEASYMRLSKFIDVAKSRSMKILEYQKKDKSIDQVLPATSLFDEEIFVIIRNFNTLTSKDIKWIEKNTNDKITLVIYHSSELGSSSIKKIKDIIIEKFDIPKIIYKFLENMSPDPSSDTKRLYLKLLENNPPEFIFTLLINHILDLYWVKCEPSKIPYPSWRVAKLEKQADLFTIKDLKRIFKKMLTIDLSVKTSSYELRDSLDLLVLNGLK